MKLMVDEELGVRSGAMVPAAGVVFEEGFMAHSLEKQIAHCDHYELAAYFKKWLPEHQPILEAGCGSGRWVAWFVKNGWSAVGLDWSEKLCERARSAIPGSHFEVGDMRGMPFVDGEFGAIISLGAIEHTAEGPVRSLNEYYRVLRPGGIAIITVPYLGPVRKWLRIFGAPKMVIVHSSKIRWLLGKRIGPRSFEEANQEILVGYSADFMMTEQGWEFFQYIFSKKQMRAFLKDTGFEIIEEFVEFGDEGILHNFGRVAGTYDYERGVVSLSAIGKALHGLLPVDRMGHMLCYLVRKDVLSERSV